MTPSRVTAEENAPSMQTLGRAWPKQQSVFLAVVFAFEGRSHRIKCRRAKGGGWGAAGCWGWGVGGVGGGGGQDFTKIHYRSTQPKD